MWDSRVSSLSHAQDGVQGQSGQRESCLGRTKQGVFQGPVPPYTDDVTDCCEHCFYGNAHHRFGLHFRQLSLALLSFSPLCVPLLEWVWGGGGGKGERRQRWQERNNTQRSFSPRLRCRAMGNFGVLDSSAKVCDGKKNGRGRDEMREGAVKVSVWNCFPR